MAKKPGFETGINMLTRLAAEAQGKEYKPDPVVQAGGAFFGFLFGALFIIFGGWCVVNSSGAWAILFWPGIVGLIFGAIMVLPAIFHLTRQQKVPGKTKSNDLLDRWDENDLKKQKQEKRRSGEKLEP